MEKLLSAWYTKAIEDPPLKKEIEYGCYYHHH